jgi:hypothetical protein
VAKQRIYMKTRYSRFDSGFLELVDEAAEFVRNNKYEDFVLVDPRQELSLS